MANSFSLNATNFQALDGSNFTLVGAGLKHSENNWSAAGEISAGFYSGKQPKLVADIKSTYDYKKYENMKLYSNTRLRTVIGDDNTTFQARISPLSADFKISDKVGASVNLNETLAYTTGKKGIKDSLNLFFELSYNISKNISAFNDIGFYDIYKHPLKKSNVELVTGLKFTF